MPRVGDIKKGKYYEKYIWTACENCGKERWVRLLKGKPRAFRCRNCMQSKITSNKHQREYNQRHYKKNRDRILEQDKQYRKERREWINNYKLSKGCKVCGYNKCAAALDFHHPNDDKEFTIASNLWKNKEVVLEEIEKCEILCKNCHAELHEKRKQNGRSEINEYCILYFPNLNSSL